MKNANNPFDEIVDTEEEEVEAMQEVAMIWQPKVSVIARRTVDRKHSGFLL